MLSDYEKMREICLWIGHHPQDDPQTGECYCAQCGCTLDPDEEEETRDEQTTRTTEL